MSSLFETKRDELNTAAHPCSSKKTAHHTDLIQDGFGLACWLLTTTGVPHGTQEEEDVVLGFEARLQEYGRSPGAGRKRILKHRCLCRPRADRAVASEEAEVQIEEGMV